MLRLEWLHATAARDRWWEEHVLLFEELKRVGKTFRYEQRRWGEMANWTGWAKGRTSAKMINGVRAYALKTQATYRGLAEEAERRFAIVQQGMPLFDKKPPTDSATEAKA